MNGYANGKKKGVNIGSATVEAIHYSYPQRSDERETFRATHSFRPDSHPGHKFKLEIPQASHYTHFTMAREWELDSVQKVLQTIR